MGRERRKVTMLTPITLNFYTPEDEVEFVHARARIPTYLLDSAIALQQKVAASGQTQEVVDMLYNFIVEFYGNKFTVEELKTKSDLVECFSVIPQVLGRANQIALQFAGQHKNPTIPSPKKK